MLRFLSRFLGYWVLAAALVAAIVDGAKSIAASALVLTPLAESWAMIEPFLAGRVAAEPAPAATTPWPLDLALAWLTAAPTAAVLAALGLLLLVAGRKRRAASFREFAT